MQKKEFGNLFIVSTPIGNLGDITYRAVEILRKVDIILAEDTRHSSKLLKYYQISKKLSAFHDHNEKSQYIKIIEKLKKGYEIALISDAGTPLINDPGFNLVRLAKQENIRVTPIPGPSSVLAAISASGLPTYNFHFMGFLPTRENDIKRLLVEKLVMNGSYIFFESPKRILKSISIIKEVLGEKIEVCIAKEITKQHENIVTGTPIKIYNYLINSELSQKGEFVILLNNDLSHNSEFFELELSVIFAALISELNPSQSARIASKLTKLNKSYCYKKLLEIKEQTSD